MRHGHRAGNEGPHYRGYLLRGVTEFCGVRCIGYDCIVGAIGSDRREVKREE